jgi:O-antigen ligase
MGRPHGRVRGSVALRPPGAPVPRDWLVIAAGVSVAWLAGYAVAAGGTRGWLALAVGVIGAAGTILGALLRSRLRWDFAAVELPALLILLAELVFRQRDAESLATNPLDLAGLYRVACISLALLLGVLALTAPRSGTSERITTRPFRLYCAYVVVVFIGAPISVNLFLTAYRGIELLVGVIVVAGAVRHAGPEAPRRILALMYWFTAISAILIWLEALAMPSQGFSSVQSPFPIQLHGIFPLVSANGTGTVGAILGLWSLARLLSPKDRGGASQRTLQAFALLGFATLVFAQYRTGFVIVAVGLPLLLALRARKAGLGLAVAAIFVAALWGGALVRGAEPIVQRGENPEVLSNLSGRFNYWSSAIPVWEQSRLLGRGLLTASRFEVLAKMGSTYTASIHGTWVEALVGTGLIGLALLGSAFLIALARAFRVAVRPDGEVVLLLLLVILLVRSITGPTFEVAGSASLVLMSIMLVLRDRPRRIERAASDHSLDARS